MRLAGTILRSNDALYQMKVSKSRRKESFGVNHQPTMQLQIACWHLGNKNKALLSIGAEFNDLE